jgi:hypothetical protein
VDRSPYVLQLLFLVHVHVFHFLQEPEDGRLAIPLSSQASGEVIYHLGLMCIHSLTLPRALHSPNITEDGAT